jgi:hypothetical protein
LEIGFPAAPGLRFAREDCQADAPAQPATLACLWKIDAGDPAKEGVGLDPERACQAVRPTESQGSLESGADEVAHAAM